MEQQTISIAKGGLVSKFNTRCTILAATNPKGCYDTSHPLTVNIALASPLLSRFDLVYVLIDSQNDDWDRFVSGFILQDKDPVKENDDGLWDIDKLQSYFSLVRTINPSFTEEANLVLSKYYQIQRQTDHRNAARTTVRLLESLVRLSQAHARLMCQQKVTVQDAVVAVSLVESSMQGCALISGIDTLHTSFPDDPMEEYKTQVELVLQKLQLHQLLNEELAQLNFLKSGLSRKSNNNVLHYPHSGGVHHDYGSSDLLVDNAEKTYINASFQSQSNTGISVSRNSFFECENTNQTKFLSKTLSPALSEKLNDVLFSIRKKRDRNICEVIEHQGNGTKKKKM